MAKVNMFFFFGLLVYLSTLLHDATARGRKRLFSKRFQFQSDSFNLFMTSKNETTNPPIHEFKVLHKGQSFETPF